jgi:hypothetical protein
MWFTCLISLCFLFVSVGSFSLGFSLGISTGASKFGDLDADTLAQHGRRITQ